MKTLLFLFIMIVLSCSVGFCAENIVSYDKSSLPVLNEELRKLNQKGDENSSSLTTAIDGLSLTGFCVVLGGDAEVATNVIPSRLYMPFGGTITKIIAYAKTAPTRANLIIDFNKNGTSILDASKITIAASGNTVTVTSFATASFSVNDYFTIDIDQIGSSVAGADITLSVYITKAV
jgi:hypothetical protein